MADRALAAVVACLFSAVALAADVERVYAAGPPASVLVFAIAPHKTEAQLDALLGEPGVLPK